MLNSPLKQRLSVIALVLANTIPIFGVLIAGWDAVAIMLLYWAENLVIGFYNLLKMLLLSPLQWPALPGRLLMMVFFTIHYGGFTGAHGMFLMGFFHFGEGGSVMGGTDWWGPLVFVQLLVRVVENLLANMPPAWAWPLLALFLSHGVSFVLNYWIGGERLRLKSRDLMMQPYQRIVLMHIAVIAGGVLMVKSNAPFYFLVLFIALKTFLDVRLHRKEHVRKQALEQVSETGR